MFHLYHQYEMISGYGLKKEKKTLYTNRFSLPTSQESASEMRLLTFRTLGFGVPTAPSSASSASFPGHPPRLQQSTWKVKQNASPFKTSLFSRWEQMETIVANWAGFGVKTVIRRLRNKGRARKNTQAPMHAKTRSRPCIRANGSKPGCEQGRRTSTSGAPCPPPHQSRHLANVTQRHNWLRWVFPRSVPAGSQKTEKKKLW